MRNQNRPIFFLGIVLAVFLTACTKGETSKTQDSNDKISQSTQGADGGSTDAPAEGEAGRIREAFGGLILVGDLSYLQYTSDEFAQVRYDDLSQWKDKNGNWCYPKGYRINCIVGDDSVMASQQFPEELLNQMDTEELYRFIMKAPGSWAQSAYDSYLQALSIYYGYYNFFAELMERPDCAQVVYKRYEKYTGDDRKKYSKMSSFMYENKKELVKQERFQLAEGLDWFFLYLDGESVPDDLVFGLKLLEGLD